MGLKQYESDQFIKTGGTSSQYLMADGSTSTGPSGGVDVGTGTANKIPKFSDSDTITDGIMTDDGTSILVDGNLAIGTADNDNLFHIEATDTTYDVSRAFEIDYTKNHSTTGWGSSAFGVRANVYAEGTGQNADIQGGSFGATHNGSGISYYLLGSQSNAKHLGSGNTGAIWGAYNRGLVSGTGTGTHPFLIGTNQVAELDNANASVGKMQSIVAYTKTSAGDVTNRLVGAEIGLDCNQGSATTVDAAVLHLEANISNLTVSGNSRTINSVSTLPSVFAGTIEATELIKTGGTSSQFLKADGSVDSNTYAVGTIPTDFVSAASGGTFSGSLTIDTDTDTILKLNNSDNGPQYVTFARSNDRHAYFGFGGSSDNFTIMSEETGGQLLLGTAAATRMTIDSDGDVGIGETTPSAKLHVKSSNSGASAVANGTFIVEAGSAPAIQILSANTQTQSIKFGDPQDGDVGTITYSHSANEMRFKTNAADRITIDSDGHVGINETSPQEELHVTGRAIISDRLAVGGNFTPQKALHMKNAAPIFRMEDSDTAGYAEFLKSSSNFTFRVDPTGVENASELRFQVDGNELMTVREDGVGFGDITPTEMVDVNGNVKADSFIKDGGTSSQFLKADGSVDSTSYTTGAHPTDFVSAASGGAFGGGITADSFTVTGFASGARFLKADGTLDATLYNSGAGTSGQISIYDGANSQTGSTRLTYNFLNNTTTAYALNVDTDVAVAGDISCDNITADAWSYIPQTFQSNFVHTSGNAYMNLPFNSLSDASSGGEQHFLVTPYAGYVSSVAFKNTATGNTMTATNMNFRVLKNGVTIYTSNTQTFTAAARTFKGWTLADDDAVFSIGDDLRFQFRCTSGFWQDTCAVVVLKGLI